MKIIFLDIDGVLNNQRFATLWNHLYGGNGWGGFFKTTTPKIKDVKWDLYNVGSLKNLLNLTGAKVVISSTWRNHHSLTTFKHIFQLYGLKPGKIIGVTPNLNTRYAYSDSYIPQAFRGNEVNAWLHNTDRNIDKYVILDDNSDFYLDQNLVQTDINIGLTDSDVDKAIKILNGGDRLNG